MKELFRRTANKISNWTGSAGAFLLAMSLVAVWALTGPVFNFSSTWQLMINTGTTIVTFLMVFLIQNTQNRDGKAMQLKLDELIRVSGPARDAFVDIEDLSDEELDELDNEFKKLHHLYANGPPPTIHKLHKQIIATRQKRLSK
jgi:low affinity Fe/Cu permease